MDVREYCEEHYDEVSVRFNFFLEYQPGECCRANSGESFLLSTRACSITLSYLLTIFSSAPHAVTMRRFSKASLTTPEASLSFSCTTAYLFTTSGVVMMYQVTIATSPLVVANVKAQLYMHPIIKATEMTAMACIREESLSDMPCCSMLAVIVMIEDVCPVGKASSVDIGCSNSALR
jgi:hypothetical protein